MLYILYGEDDFSRHQALQEIKTGLGADDMLAANTTWLEGKQLSLAQLAATCDTVPFLAPQRLVIVEGLLERFESKPGTEGPSEILTLTDYVKRMPSSTTLVLIDSDLKSNNFLLKALSPLATVKYFPRPKGDALGEWIRKRVTQAGRHISTGAVSPLAELVGNDLWALSAEIDKLLLYCEGRTIEEKDVQDVVSQTYQANIFSLADAVLEGYSSRAIRLLHRLLDEGAHPAYLLVMLTRQFRLALQTKELNSQGLTLPQIQQQMGGTNPYAVKKALAQCRKHTQQRLEKAYRQLLETDLSIKQGKYDGELALDLLVTELSRGC